MKKQKEVMNITNRNLETTIDVKDFLKITSKDLMKNDWRKTTHKLDEDWEEIRVCAWNCKGFNDNKFSLIKVIKD